MKSTIHKKGFTLIELLVVIAVIGVLSGVVLQSLNSARAKARNTTRLAQIDQIEKGFQIGITGTTNTFPLVTAFKCLGKTSCWQGFYTNDVTVDTVLAAGMGQAAPTDPLFKTGQFGDTVLYLAATGLYGEPSATAYLYWGMEDTGATVKDCGRGVVWANPMGGTPGVASYSCKLFIGAQK